MVDRLFSEYGASKELGPFFSKSTNPGAVLSGTNDYNLQFGIEHLDDTSGLSTGFSNLHTLSVQQTVNGGGLNTNGGNTTAKFSYIPFQIIGSYQASGQRFGTRGQLTGLGFGDLCWDTVGIIYAGGCVDGDEGTGFCSVSYLAQLDRLVTANIDSIPTQATISTTTTQAIVGNRVAQTVNVASTTGVIPGQWIVVEQEVQTKSPNLEAVQVISVGSGNINGIFRLHHPSGVTITAAKVLNVNSSGNMGQDRLLVNLSGSSYSTGTVTHPNYPSDISTGGFTGSGTSWSTSMVGGTATNIGAIALTADDYTGTPFSSGAGTLKSWYALTGVSDATHLAVFSNNVAGDASYKGNGVATSGGYIVRPAARILHISGDQLILETSAHTWAVNDTVECAICPYTYVCGFQYAVQNWTATGSNLVGFFSIGNNGARAFQTGIDLHARGLKSTGGGDSVGWVTGISLDGCAVGLKVIRASTAAIQLNSLFGYGAPVTDASGKIDWNGCYIMPNSANVGMDFQLTFAGPGGKLSSIHSSVLSESQAQLSWTGSMKWTGYADISEMTAPAAPAANIARLYSDDNGSGKTRLVAKFSDNSTVVIATQP